MRRFILWTSIACLGIYAGAYIFASHVALGPIASKTRFYPNSTVARMFIPAAHCEAAILRTDVGVSVLYVDSDGREYWPYLYIAKP